MAPQTFLDWIAWAGLVIPLMALAWSAWHYVDARKREVAHNEFRRIFEVMDQLGRPGGSIASQMIAAYELRKFPEYKDVIVRFCDQAKIEGSSAEMLRMEIQKTREFFVEGKR